jgi:hypothetical protein
MDMTSRSMAKKAKTVKEPKVNMNALPMPYNRLADRGYRSPTPEPEIENPEGLDAYNARASMSMKFDYIAPPQDAKPMLVSSSSYYSSLNNENGSPLERCEVPESRDHHEKYYG